MSLYFFYNQKDKNVTFPRNTKRKLQTRCPPFKNMREPLRHPEDVLNKDNPKIRDLERVLRIYLDCSYFHLFYFKTSDVFMLVVK